MTPDRAGEQDREHELDRVETVLGERDLLEPHLVTAARDGDPDAFAELVRTHQDRLYAVALRMTGQPQDAQDVVQDALLQAWRSLPSYRGEARFGTWVTRIVINRCHNLRRGARPQQALPDEDATGEDQPPSLPPAEDVAVGNAHQAAVQAAVLDLPFDQRAALVLHVFAGCTHAETGRILGVTESAAKVRVHRARRALTDRLREWR